MSIHCIIQARAGSTRLPGKVLIPILGKPMLQQVVERVAQSRLIDKIIIATTDNPQDDSIAALCEDHQWQYYRGSENDVLDRYYQAAQQTSATVIVRITSDCPLIDPTVLDLVVASFVSVTPAADYVSNTMVRTYPRGLDTEVFSFSALERAWIEDKAPNWREHVTPYIHQQPKLFRLHSVVNPVDYSHYRLTVDTPADMDLIQQIYQFFGENSFTWHDVLKILAQHPDWVQINADVEQKSL
jgi:spore coat polysaccharide biosynthesis protein SpsF